MYICSCNAFNDKTAREYLSNAEGRVTVSEVYKACSEGETPSKTCKNPCLNELKDLVKAHNDAVAAGLPTPANNNNDNGNDDNSRKIPVQNVPAI